MKKKKQSETSKKKTIRILNKKIEILDRAHRVLVDEIGKRERIILALGSEEHLKKIYYGKYHTKEISGEIEISPETYADYVAISDWEEERFHNEAVRELVDALARGLIASNAVQIIVKEPEQEKYRGLFGTIGVKLTVIPWYELMKREEEENENHE